MNSVTPTWAWEKGEREGTHTYAGLILLFISIGHLFLRGVVISNPRTKLSWTLKRLDYVPKINDPFKTYRMSSPARL